MKDIFDDILTFLYIPINTLWRNKEYKLFRVVDTWFSFHSFNFMVCIYDIHDKNKQFIIIKRSEFVKYFWRHII